MDDKEVAEQYIEVLLDQETHAETPEYLGADQIVESEDEQAYQNKITEGLNDVDDKVVRFYKLKVVVRACHGAYFVAHVFKYLAPNFVSGRPA